MSLWTTAILGFLDCLLSSPYIFPTLDYFTYYYCLRLATVALNLSLVSFAVISTMIKLSLARAKCTEMPSNGQQESL
jgi:hypothetical protein